MKRVRGAFKALRQYECGECAVVNRDRIPRVVDRQEQEPVLPSRSLSVPGFRLTSPKMATGTETWSVLTIGGTPTTFLPLATPYPSKDGCDTNIYQLTSAAPTFLAWDPAYGKSVTDAASCIPSYVSTWWFQDPDASYYTALGPTFACPEAYSTVSTTATVVTTGTASSVQKVYCCPSYVPSLEPRGLT